MINQNRQHVHRNVTQFEFFFFFWPACLSLGFGILSPRINGAFHSLINREVVFGTAFVNWYHYLSLPRVRSVCSDLFKTGALQLDDVLVLRNCFNCIISTSLVADCLQKFSNWFKAILYAALYPY